MQMILWSIAASSQVQIHSRATFLFTRSLLGFLQGGFIPDVVLYLSYFYKHHELSIRLGFFWTAMVFADIFAAFSAFGLLHMRGVWGMAGWRWLFLIEVGSSRGPTEYPSLTPSKGTCDHGVRDACLRSDAGRPYADGKLVPGQKGVVHTTVRTPDMCTAFAWSLG